jgi:hypothetical protein
MARAISAAIWPWLARKELASAAVTRTGQLFDLPPLLRRRFGRERAQRLGHEPLALGTGDGGALDVQALDYPVVGGPDLLRSFGLLGTYVSLLAAAPPGGPGP